MSLKRKLRVLAVTMGAVGALVAVSASPAMATVVQGKYSAGTIKLTGSVTVKKNGAEAKTCELKPPATGETGGGKAFIHNTGFAETVFSCNGGTVLTIWAATTTATYDTVTGVYSFSIGSSYEGKSPWGYYYFGVNGLPTGIWSNGAGATQSTITFNEANFGTLASGGYITVSGTLTATTSTGGLLTLSH